MSGWYIYGVVMVLLVIFYFWADSLGSDGWAGFWFVIGVGTALVGVIGGCQQTDWYKEDQREKEAQIEADKQPRVIREVDGCKVYAFKSGDKWHYFTRCPNAIVSTDTTHTRTERVGKTTRTVEEIGTIVTESK